jgi:inorganic pyrophosphatase
MSVIRANPIGILLTEDEEGQDSKVVAVPIAKLDPSFSNITNINNVPEHTRNEIKHFFEHYKELEKGKYVKVKGWEDKEVANRRISEAIDRYRNNI